jgi:peroxiredoxin
MTYNNIFKAAAHGALLLSAALLLGACGEQRFLAPDAADFSLPLLAAPGEFTLSEHRGEVVYVTFWASWCVPGREEMPFLSALWQRHRAEGLQVIGVNVDEDIEAARAFAKDFNIEFPLVWDEDRSVSKLYRVAGYPSHYVLDRRGKVRYSALGFTETDSLAVSQEVGTLLAEPGDAAD